MAELKTKKNQGSVEDFLSRVENSERKEDCDLLTSLMENITGDQACMWGDSIVGFGSHNYKYANGKEGTWFEIGFAPRKQNLTLYLMHGFDDMKEPLSRLGKFKTGKACLYVKQLSEVDVDVLQELLKLTIKKLRNRAFLKA